MFDVFLRILHSGLFAFVGYSEDVQSITRVFFHEIRKISLAKSDQVMESHSHEFEK